LAPITNELRRLGEKTNLSRLLRPQALRGDALTQPLDAPELPARAVTLAPSVITWAVAYADSIAGDLTAAASEAKTHPSPTPAILLEALLLTIHVVDRLAFQVLGPDRRNLFMDSLLDAIHGQLPAVGIPPVVLQEAYAEKQFHYSQFKKMFAPQEESPKDTLCWEFGKVIVTRYGDANPIGATLIATGAMHTIGAIHKILHDPRCGIVRADPAA
jgi:hypothetical protein